MDKSGIGRREHKASAEESLTRVEAPILREVINEGDVSLNAMWAQLSRLMPQLAPDYSATETYQSGDGGRQYQFAPIVGASAVQTQQYYTSPQPEAQYSQDPVEQADFAAWEREISQPSADAAPQVRHAQPQRLNDAVNDAVAEAERLVAEAYKNDPYARPEGAN